MWHKLWKKLETIDFNIQMKYLCFCNFISFFLILNWNLFEIIVFYLKGFHLIILPVVFFSSISFLFSFSSRHFSSRVASFFYFLFSCEAGALLPLLLLEWQTRRLFSQTKIKIEQVQFDFKELNLDFLRNRECKEGICEFREPSKSTNQQRNKKISKEN